MWKNITLLTILAMLGLAKADSDKPATDSGPKTGVVAEEKADAVVTLWKQMRRADLASDDFTNAKEQLLSLLKGLSASQKCVVAAKLMDRNAESGVNASAIALFGADAFEPEHIRKLLFNPKRTFAQRLMLRTCYSFCRADSREAVLSKQMDLQLVDLLAKRLESLAGTSPPYGEQRLLVHLCTSVLSRHAHGESDVRQVNRFIAAMKGYAKVAARGEPLGKAIDGWLALRDKREGLISDVSSALAALGHWDSLVRWKAAAFLGERAGRSPDDVQQIYALLEDPRDEVRAAAVRVFVFVGRESGEKIVPRMVQILTRGRGTVVQAAAGEVLAAHSEYASDAVGLLLDAFNAARRPGPKRTDSILRTLAHFVPVATDAQQKRILELAEAQLTRAPQGALAALKALGPFARSAVPAIKACRENADRTRRRYINQHVLPAITQQPTKG